MSNGLFGIGITGINAAQLGLMTTGNNIANVDTPGYNRQRIIQANNISVATGSGFIGMGTRVDTISRIYNQVITDQINGAQTKVSEYSTYYDQIKQIDNMMADEKAGLSPSLQAFFKGIQSVASNPALITSRDAMVSSAQTLTNRLQSMEARLNSMYKGVNDQLQSTVASINSYATQIAELNEKIMLAQAATNQPANSLLDQRDYLVSELNKQVAVNTVEDANGALNVFIGTGQQLVVGLRANELQVKTSSADPERMAVALTNAGGAQELPENLLTGGVLGGLLRFRSESLDKAANSLGQVAASIALTFNAQQALGQDMLGQTAADGAFASTFFQLSNPRVWPNTLNAGTGVVSSTFVSPPPMSLNGNTYSLTYDSASATYTATRKSDGTSWTATGANALNSVVQQVATATGVTLDLGSANYTTNLTGSDYRLSYDGTNYTVQRLSDGKKWTDPSLANLSSTLSTSDGISLSATGAMTNGDSFLIQPTREVARNISLNPAIAADSRLIAAGQSVRSSAATANTGTGVISSGSVSPGYTTPAAPTNFTFNSGTNTFDFSAFTGSVTVTTSAGTTTYAAPANAVPYSGPSSRYTVNGFTFEVSGNPANGDTFTLGKNTTGVSDTRNISKMGLLQTKGTMFGGDATFQAGYAQIVSNVGNKTKEAQVTRDAQQALVDQSTAAREAQSGVNLDEEAANLLKYQNAYQASAKMMSIASELFNTILSIRG